MEQRILIFAAYFLPFSGGYANSIFQLAVRLRAHGHMVTIVTANTEGVAAEENLQGVQVYRLPCWNILGGTYPVPKPTAGLRNILRRLRADHYTVVSTQTRFFMTSMLGAWFARNAKIPYLHTERGSRHSIVRNVLVYWVSIIIDHTLGRWVVRGARQVVGVSAAAQSFALHMGAREATVIPNGVNEEFIHSPLAPKTSPAGAPLTVIYVGRLIYAKGVQDLLNAIASLRQTGQDPRLTIVGSGPHESALQVLVNQLKLDSVVTFTGEQTREQIADLLSQHDLFVNPSYSEGLPTSVLEAAAAGIGVIATDVGGTREIVPSDLYGLLYTPGDVQELVRAVTRYTNDPDQRVQAAQLLAERTAREFSWTAVTEKYEELFRQVTHNP